MMINLLNDLKGLKFNYKLGKKHGLELAETQCFL